MTNRTPLYLAGVLVALAIVAAIIWLTLLRERPVSLTIASGQKGGVYLPLAEGVRDAILAAEPAWRVRVVESEGSAVNLEAVSSGSADIGLVENTLAVTPEVRTLSPLYLEVLHFLKRRSLTIETMADLSGKRISVGIQGSGTARLARILLTHYGLDESALDLRYMSTSDSIDALIAGELDAMLLVAGLTSPACERAIASGQVDFVGFGSPDDEHGVVEGLRFTHPFLEEAIIPRHTYGTSPGVLRPEPGSPISTLGVRALLVCNARMPEEIAQRVAGQVHQGRASLIARHRVAAQISESFDESRLQIPLHPGAEAFYRRDEPTFLAENAELIGLLISILAMLYAGVMAARRWFQQRKKDRIDVYMEEIGRLSEKIDSAANDPTAHAELEETLHRIRRDALNDLVHERVQANNSFQIFQTLLSDAQTRLDTRRS